MTRMTGRRMSAILVVGFSVVIAVNIYAAVVAKETFGGVVVENSYVASQDYNRWLDEAARERALGWQVTPHRRADGRIEVLLGGVPRGVTIAGEARHPLGTQPDIDLHFGADNVSKEMLPAGRWTLRLTVAADGNRFRTESAVQ